MKTVEEKITAWIDGRLSERDLAEFERQLAATPQLLSEKASALEIGNLLRAHCQGPELQNPEFFNHQLLQRIAAEEARGCVERSASGQRSFFFSLSRMAWAGACCLIAAALLYICMIPGGRRSNPTARQYIAQIENARTEDPAISVTAFHSKAENVTVLWLDGLNYLPDWEKL